MPYTLGEAAQAVGKAKSTIFKAIKDGVISSSRDERGRFVIEPAELHRVFPPVVSVVAAERSPEQPAEQTRTDAGAFTATLECGFLRREVEQLRTLLDDARSERDEWRRQAQTLASQMPALTDQTKPNGPATVPSVALEPRRPWWRRLARA